MKLSYVAFSYLCLFCLGLIDNSRGPLYPEILKFYNISATVGSLIFSFSALSSFLTAYMSKRWITKYSLVFLSRVALLLHFSACIIMGFSTNATFGLYWFFMASIVFGIGVGLFTICLNLIINTTVSAVFKRRVYAGLHSMYGVASLLAPFIIQIALEEQLTFHEYFLSLSTIPFLFLVLFAFIKPVYAKFPITSKEAITKKNLHFISIMFAFYITGEVVISTRLIIYLSEIKHFTFEQASNYLTYFFICLLCGRVLFSLLNIKISNKILLYISIVTSIISLVFGIVVYTPALFISGLAMSYFFPCAMDWISETYKLNSNQIIAKIMVVVGASLVLMHWVFGAISDTFGLNTAIFIAPILHLIVLCILLFKTKFMDEIE